MDSPENNPWPSLRHHTQARIGLGSVGISIPAKENLDFKLAHALARDAIYTKLETAHLQEQLRALHPQVVLLHSKAADRQQYLQRPDLGRRLDEASLAQLQALQTDQQQHDVCITIADGLSAMAIHQNALPLLGRLIPLLKEGGLSLAPICIVEEGRVAVSDETGSCLNAQLSLILIGERPGLSSPDSLGIYLTYRPAVGNTDALRNCISNVRPAGLDPVAAAEKVHYLVSAALRLRMTGVMLKDDSGLRMEG